MTPRGPYYRGAKPPVRPGKPELERFLVPKAVRPELAKRWRNATDVVTPGSFEAIRRGCRCSRTLNCYGRGVSNGFMADHCRFDVAADCPLHNDKDGAR